MAMTKLTKLGNVVVGDRFVWRTAEIMGEAVKGTTFEGQTLTVLGFMPASYVSRVVLRTENAAEILLRLDVVERGLRLYPVQARAQ